MFRRNDCGGKTPNRLGCGAGRVVLNGRTVFDRDASRFLVGTGLLPAGA